MPAKPSGVALDGHEAIVQGSTGIPRDGHRVEIWAARPSTRQESQHDGLQISRCSPSVFVCTAPAAQWLFSSYSASDRDGTLAPSDTVSSRARAWACAARRPFATGAWGEAGRASA